MGYEINVSHNGAHYFATAERSLQERRVFLQVLADFRQQFPEVDGYLITATFRLQRGYKVDLATGDHNAFGEKE